MLLPRIHNLSVWSQTNQMIFNLHISHCLVHRNLFSFTHFTTLLFVYLAVVCFTAIILRSS